MRTNLGCKVLSLPITYLGIPLGANPRRVETWNPIIEKIRKKLSGWKMKMISRAGRLVLIKSVLNNLPMYYLGLFKMPKQVAKTIISLQSRFFWGNKDGNSAMALVRWDIIQRPRKLGGLGIGDIVLKNAGMLFKWWWRFSVENSPLWKQVICSCYDLDPNKALIDQHSRNNGGLWGGIRSILKSDRDAGDVLEMGVHVLVGNGRNTLLWEDLWVGEMRLMQRFPRLYAISLQRQTSIADCGLWDGGRWHWSLLWRREFFQWELDLFNQFQQVLEQAQLTENQEDRSWWRFHNSGRYSVHSFLKKVYEQKGLVSHNTSFAACVWKGVAPPKVELLLWFILLGRLNTKDRLLWLNILPADNYRCVICNEGEESISHLFFTCNFAWRVWSCCCDWWGLTWVIHSDPRSNFESWTAIKCSKNQRKMWLSCFYVIIWSLWELRNKVIFQNKEVCWKSFMMELLHNWKWWNSNWTDMG